MYTIHHDKTNNVLEIKNTKATVYGKLVLNQGASLQELTLLGHSIIQDLSPLPYSDTYASALLFPFANRIKDGIYEFEGTTYKLEKNQTEEQNALHGLIYDKVFEIVAQKTTPNSANIILSFEAVTYAKGFPFKYTFTVEYVFTEDNLRLNVSVKNNDYKPFPFTIGWHPYFISDNLFNSTIAFESNEKLTIGERNITTGRAPYDSTQALKIEDMFLDDCWILNNDEIIFNTPNYNLKFSATGSTNFLQLYTPPRKNTIAIEPTTGVSDSFNNKIGLQTLAPNDIYSMTWQLHIKNN